jgi:hypothetical protein
MPKDAMRKTARLLLTSFLVASVASCANGPKERINPPVASLQELSVQPDGHWRLLLRLQNYSNVATTFSSVQARLLVAGQDAGEISLDPKLTVGPESADVVPVLITPSLAAKTAAASALAAMQALPYVLNGQIASSKPKREHDFHYESSLNPAPGLRGVLR